jgi:hypothetical protein
VVRSIVSIDATRFECWWPVARGNPAPAGCSRGPASGRAREVEGSARRVPIKRPAQAVMEGGNAYPSCLEQASLLRATRTAGHRTVGNHFRDLCASTRIRLASDGDIVPG